MFCLQCALSCVGRRCLSAAELQRAFLPFQGTDLKQLTPGSRTLWQVCFLVFFLIVQIFSLGSLAPEIPASNLQPHLKGLFFVGHPAFLTETSISPCTSASPRALYMEAWQGAGVCQRGTGLLMGSNTLLLSPWPYVKDNHSKASLNPQMFCLSRLCGALSAGWDWGRQRGNQKEIKLLSLSMESFSLEGFTGS